MDTEANEVGRVAQGPVTLRLRRDWKREAIRWQAWALWAIMAAAAEGVVIIWQAVKLGVAQ